MLTTNPFGAHYFWEGADLSGLLEFDRGYFIVMALLMIIVSVMKALMFYCIIKILHDKKLNMDQPFNQEIRRLIFNLSYSSLAIELFSVWASGYSEWLVGKGVLMPSLQPMHVDGDGAWWFISIILFVIGHIFKRGIELRYPGVFGRRVKFCKPYGKFYNDFRPKVPLLCTITLKHWYYEKVSNDFSRANGDGVL